MKKMLMVVLVAILGLSLIGISTATACDFFCEPGTGTPGYWKNHPEAWPVNSVIVGTSLIGKEDAIQMMNLPIKGNKWLTMFSAFVAAQLNVWDGNRPPTCVTLKGANLWFVANPVGSVVEANSSAWQNWECICFCLDDYNNGLLPGIPSRDDLE